MFACTYLRVASTAVLAAVGWMALGGAAAVDEPTFNSEGAAVQDANADPKNDPDAEKQAADKKKRAGMVKTFSRKLGRLKPVGSKKKAMDDYYLLGTAELNPATGHADVCFQVKQGQVDVAEFLVGYILDAPESSLRKWHVFSRLKEAQQAEQALQFLRAQYDQMAGYQAQIRRIYRAKTVRRT